MRDRWEEIGSLDPAQLRDPSLELHWASQVLASAGHAFAERRPDDSHRAMTWDRSSRALVGAPFTGPYPFRVALRAEDLTLLLLDRTGEALGSLALPGATLDQAYAWLAGGLATYAGAAAEPLTRPEFEIPGHPVGEGAPFGEGGERERRLVARLYGASAAMLGELISSRDDAAPVRCWPHHFDIATLITVARGSDAESARTVGAGMAPMGGGYDSWYLYVTPWPYPEAAALPALEGPGKWHTEGWTGAVLTGREIADATGEFRGAMVRKFLDVSVDAAIASLSV